MHVPHMDREAVAPVMCAMAGFGGVKGHAAPAILSSEHRLLFCFMIGIERDKKDPLLCSRQQRGLSELKISQLVGKTH